MLEDVVKSVLLNQIKDELMNEKRIKVDHIISINFEDVKFYKIKNYNKLNDYILKQIIDDNKYYIFLDEIQHVKQFEKVLKLHLKQLKMCLYLLREVTQNFYQVDLQVYWWVDVKNSRLCLLLIANLLSIMKKMG